MRLRDFTAIFVALIAAVLGMTVVPQNFVPWLEHVPFYTLMGSLYISFVPLDMGATMRLAWHNKHSFIIYTLIRHLVISSAVFGIFYMIMPDYRLPALLIAGASIASAAPFLAYLAGADVGLTTVLTIMSSAIVPFTLPFLVAILMGSSIEISKLSMMFTLAQIIVVPAVAAFFTRSSRWLSTKVAEQGYFWGMMMVFLSCIAIFARYKNDLLSSPDIAWEAFLASWFTAFSLIALGFLYSLFCRDALKDVVILCEVETNLTLAIVLGAQFFGPREAITGVMYILPFYAAVPLLHIIFSLRKTKA